MGKRERLERRRKILQEAHARHREKNLAKQAEASSSTVDNTASEQKKEAATKARAADRDQLSVERAKLKNEREALGKFLRIICDNLEIKPRGVGIGLLLELGQCRVPFRERPVDIYLSGHGSTAANQELQRRAAGIRRTLNRIGQLEARTDPIGRDVRKAAASRIRAMRSADKKLGEELFEATVRVVREEQEKEEKSRQSRRPTLVSTIRAMQATDTKTTKRRGQGLFEAVAQGIEKEKEKKKKSRRPAAVTLRVDRRMQGSEISRKTAVACHHVKVDSTTGKEVRIECDCTIRPNVGWNPKKPDACLVFSDATLLKASGGQLELDTSVLFAQATMIERSIFNDTLPNPWSRSGVDELVSGLTKC